MIFELLSERERHYKVRSTAAPITSTLQPNTTQRRQRRRRVQETINDIEDDDDDNSGWLDWLSFGFFYWLQGYNKIPSEDTDANSYKDK
jgi:hypothetical protein